MMAQQKLKLGAALAFVLIGLNAFDLQAQYNLAIGARIGGTSGITIKHFYAPSIALEGLVGTFGNGFSFTGLLEKYKPAFDTEGLSVYYGGGAHLAIYTGQDIYSSRFGREIDYHKHNDVGFGINGVIGLEYRLPDDIPVAFSIDLKPFIEVGSGGFVGFAPDPSVGVKFIIK